MVAIADASARLLSFQQVDLQNGSVRLGRPDRFFRVQHDLNVLTALFSASGKCL
jgi:hypothetical protein